jgi:hypothetical protein
MTARTPAALAACFWSAVIGFPRAVARSASESARFVWEFLP